MKRIDDRLVKTSLPGQYVTVRMRMPDGIHQPRQYSLTRADDGAHRQFSAKRVYGGDGRPPGEMSTLLHDSVDVGDILTLSLPYGNVVLDDSGRPVVFHGTMDLSAVDLPQNATYYLCGPLPFMRALRGSLLTRGVVLPDDIHYEVFGPDLWQADLE